MISVVGATGYTGRLVAAELSRLRLPLRLAARSPRRLEQLAATLPARPELAQVDVGRPETLAALAGSSLLISCAGPFTDLGKPVAAYAARHGMRYLDITNELSFVHEVYSGFGELARASGATLVPSCGFEVAFADCAAALLAAQLCGRQQEPPAPHAGAPLDEVRVTYRLPGQGSSYGTRASALRSLSTSWLSYEGGALRASRPWFRSARARIGGGQARTLTFPSSELLTIPAHLAVRSVQTSMTVTWLGALYGPRLLPWLIPLLSGPVGWGLRLASRFAARPPSERRRQAMPFALLVEVRRGAASERLELRGVDPYGLTARVVGFAAQALLEGRPAPGVLAPAQVLDPRALLDAARGWGVTVERAHEEAA